MTEYEIKCGLHGWYQGFVRDFDPETKKFYVTYPEDWKPANWESPENIRPLPDAMNMNLWTPQLDEAIECQAQEDQKDAFPGWFPCTIRGAIRGNYAVIFDNWPESQFQFPKQYLRPKNTKRPLSTTNLQRKVIKVSEELVDWVASNPRELADIQKKQPRLILMEFNPEKRELVIVAANVVLNMVSGLIESYFQKHKSLMEYEKKVHEKEEKVKQQKAEEENAVKASFRIHPFLTGYMFGKERKHMGDVRDLYRVNVKEGVCEITGKSQEAVDHAVDKLHVVAKKLLMHKRQVGCIFGRKGDRMKMLRSRCDGIHIMSLKTYPEEFQLLKERMIKNIRRGDRRKRNSKYRTADDEQDETVPIPPEVANANEDELFIDPSDIIDLSGDNEPDDALILIGRRKIVELCVIMIEMTLQRWQESKARQQHLFELRDRLRELKGIPLLSERERTDRRRPRDRRNREDQDELEEQDLEQEYKYTEKSGRRGRNFNNREKGGRGGRGGRGRRQEDEEEEEQEQEQEQEEQEEEEQERTEPLSQKKGKGRGKERGTYVQKSKNIPQKTEKPAPQRDSKVTEEEAEEEDENHATQKNHQNGTGKKTNDTGTAIEQTSAENQSAKKKRRRKKENQNCKYRS